MQHRQGEIFDIIREQCSDAFNAFANARKILYRGADYSGTVFHGRTRIDRGTATDPEAVKEIDAVFAAHGFKALRTQSMSCATSYGDAGNFGSDVFAIFPVNGFSFTWSPMVHDFGRMTGGDVLLNRLPKVIAKHGAENLEDLLINKFQFSDKDFESALKSGNEIAIAGEYYALKFANFGSQIPYELGIQQR